MAIQDNKTLREQARKDIEAGAVTTDYQLNLEESIKVLNDALATELVCTLRYTQHYFMANGIHGTAVAAEFLEHANEEHAHAMKLAERIQQLGGKPDFNPETLVQRSHAEYREGATLAEMIRENLIAERIAIMAYRQAIEFFGEKDSTSRRLLEWILEQEEEHAADLADFMSIHRETKTDTTPTPSGQKSAQQGK
jgi:bacterioferritin